jgi:mono/diheme cytochrome c family protein
MFRVRPGSGPRPIPLFATQLVAATVLMTPAVCAATGQAASSAAPTGRAFVERYCVSCHSKRLHTGDIVLEDLDPSRASENAATWEKVVRKVRVGAMPPSGARQPDRAGAESFVAELQTTLDRAAGEHPNIGHVPALHRLNRTEYSNAIRDLLALDALPKEMGISVLLPPDDSGGGFDNMADALYVSPALIERYVGAAGKISRLAIGDPTAPPIVDTYRASGQMPQDVHVEGLPFGTRGGMLIARTFPVDGKYTFAVQVAQGGAYEPNRDAPPYQIELLLDGARVKVFTQQKGEGRRGRGAGAALQADLDVTAGPHDVGITFIADAAAPVESLVVPYRRSLGIEPAAVAALTISGPTGASSVGDTPTRRRIFVCRPRAQADELPCATRIISMLARRAYRRPVTPRDLQPLVAFYEKGRADGSFDLGIRRALERLLVSPEFLFRVETPAPAGGGPVLLTDLELASRLSFFFWSSIPDDELLDVAAAARLHLPAVFAQQVRRLIADRRSNALIDNFVGQWLYLRDLTDAKHPDDRLFPDFDEGLQASMRRETELFFASLVRDNRSILDLLRAEYTFLNERLAQHYGIPNVHGTQFRRVSLPDDSPRRGLLGQGSLLTVTSYANRTSPVNRGKFILETLLLMPPPPPPAVVPSLKDTDASGAVLSMRGRMEQHRKDPACASCHKQMDPLGFALENFDAVGRWRTNGESNEPIDNSGTLTNGSTFNGVNGLRAVLLRRPYDTEFVYTVVSKLLTYALGRPAEAVDQPAVRKIMRAAAPSEYSFEAVLLGIVNSASFRMKQPPAATVAEARR